MDTHMDRGAVLSAGLNTVLEAAPADCCFPTGTTVFFPTGGNAHRTNFVTIFVGGSFPFWFRT